MKLFIFKPSQFWAYCGGMLIVTAPSYEEACKRLQDKENVGSFPTTFKFALTEFATDPGLDRPHTCREVDTWVLFRVVDVWKSVDLCEIEYNYS
jgi:hypothetical protein